MNSFYDMLQKLPTMEVGGKNAWDLTPVEELGIAIREEPTDEELMQLKYGFNLEKFAAKSQEKAENA